MTKIVPTKARYEAGTKTIRSVPENYWLASMDNWDGAVDHERTALLFAAAPELFEAGQRIIEWFDSGCDPSTKSINALREAVNKAEGKP